MNEKKPTPKRVRMEDGAKRQTGRQSADDDQGKTPKAKRVIVEDDVTVRRIKEPEETSRSVNSTGESVPRGTRSGRGPADYAAHTSRSGREPANYAAHTSESGREPADDASSRFHNTRRERESSISPDRKPEPKENKGIMLAAYLFVGIFLAMIVHMVYFVQVQSAEVINSSYNRRESVLAKRVIRGEILSADGKVLAQTKTNKNGEEYRYYPYDCMFAHAVGRFDKGKTGIEAAVNLNLLASHSNGISNAFRELSGEKLLGDQAVTTLNYRLQKVAHDTLGERRGAIVALEPSTGKILALVSKPDYDPNQVNDIWEDLQSDDNRTPLLNRATQGLYPPGSTFKVVTTLSYLRQSNQYKKFSFTCDGTESYAGVKINCYHQKAHGKVDLQEAFAVSCNGAFAGVGMELDLGEYRKTCEELLFNASIPADLAVSQSQFVLSADSEEEDVPQTAIGQGKTLMTPMHNAMIAASIANGGVLMRPYLLDRMESADGHVVSRTKPETAATLMTPQETKILTEYMRSVVTDGTGYALQTSAYKAAGKTGTAEYNADKDSHAWFIGFAPLTNPQIAVCVLVENGGAASDSAVPIARKLFDAYLLD